MSEIRITPDFENKCAEITGAASAGEKVRVILKNCSTKNTPTLRLRVLFAGKTLAVFPVSVTETTQFEADGDDLVCELNLCTDQALKVFKRIPELDVLYILDDPGSSVRQMYFRDFHVLLGWPHEVTDTPIDLSTYTDRMKELDEAVDGVRESLESAVEDLSASLESKVDKVSGKGLSSVDVTPETLAGFALAEDLSRHVADTDLHLRAGERIAWSGKVNPEELAGKQDIIVAGGALYIPRASDGDVQLYHRAQIVYNAEIGYLVLDIGETTYVKEDGAFVEYAI